MRTQAKRWASAHSPLAPRPCVAGGVREGACPGHNAVSAALDDQFHETHPIGCHHSSLVNLACRSYILVIRSWSAYNSNHGSARLDPPRLPATRYLPSMSWACPWPSSAAAPEPPLGRLADRSSPRGHRRVSHLKRTWRRYGPLRPLCRTVPMHQ